MNQPAKNRMLVVQFNEAGRRINESHPRAKLMDREVDQVLELVEDGLSYQQVATIMDVGKSCVAKLVRGERRAQHATRVVRVRCP